MRRLVSLTLVLGLAPGCSPDEERGDLLVFAAASLTEAFGEAGRAFERRNPEATVRFGFGPSDALATQIVEGAPADVFASASPAWMDEVVERGPGVKGRTDLARNRLVVLVPAGNPAGVAGIEDLATPGVRLVLAAPDVPVGEYGREALANAGIADPAEANVVSNEEDVKGVVQKVALGEADAGIAYVTDVTPEVAEDVAAVEIPDRVNVVATYPIAVVRGSDAPDLAAAFVDFVLGAGRRFLVDAGFMPPE
jgi:molybdate transport system substrate-binding protein